MNHAMKQKKSMDNISVIFLEINSSTQHKIKTNELIYKHDLDADPMVEQKNKLEWLKVKNLQLNDNQVVVIDGNAFKGLIADLLDKHSIETNSRKKSETKKLMKLTYETIDKLKLSNKLCMLSIGNMNQFKPSFDVEVGLTSMMNAKKHNKNDDDDEIISYEANSIRFKQVPN
jgi:hypothetical protein